MSGVQMMLLSQKYIAPQPDKADRLIAIQGQSVLVSGARGTNSIHNQRYTVLTFLPKVLYQQFRYFFNLFYLLTALSQFIPVLKIGLMFSFVAPLALVLLLTMFKQAYEDYQRYLKDKQINSATFSTHRGKVPSCELQVGDIIELNCNDSVPADCIFLHSPKQTMFVKTDQLDGETDWKLRKCLGEKVDNMRIQYSQPNAKIYEFLGVVNINGVSMGLSLEHTLWRGLKVAAGGGTAIVIYVGQETKLSMNIKEVENKFGKLDQELNLLSKILFMLMVILAGVLVLMRGLTEQFFITFFKYFLLLSSIIPISMRVNLDFAKLIYKYLIEHDKEMPNAQCRSSNITQQLGQISYVLSDKTGTLTKNEMIFRKLYLSEAAKYEAQDILQLFDGGSEIISDDLHESILALMVCHNVTAVEQKQAGRLLQGSSPDEVTLVTFGQSLGYVLRERTQQSIVIELPNRSTIQYRIEQVFPFTSQSKRMGIVVSVKDKTMYYVKGADTVIMKMVSAFESEFIKEACLDLAREGLRTLAVAKKDITSEFKAWRQQYEKAKTAFKDRQLKIQAVRKILECNMNFVGVTGVEDKLQPGVVEAITAFKSIGIKVWILTGDKVETAICVGRAVGLIHRDDNICVVQAVKCNQQLNEQMDELKQLNSVLVIDGQGLSYALTPLNEKQFFQAANRANGVICSRVSPTQKADMAALVMKYASGRVLGVGDGGNDVALIQTAHVGVGIYGKEGIQAALASDFSIDSFSDLMPLMLWHGRLAYRRSSLLSQFIIHRGVIITIMQCIFIIVYYFVPIPIYNGLLLLGYTTVFTMLPVFSLILDEDITRHIALQYPLLYLNRTHQPSIVSLISWLFISIYQGSIIMIIIVVLPQSFLLVTTISFTCLIIIEFLNIFNQLNRIYFLQIVSIALSLLIYFVSVFLMPSYINGVVLFQNYNIGVTAIIISLAWSPPFIYERIMRIVNPSEEQKVMKSVKM